MHITFFTSKGGTGKTTSAVTLISAIAEANSHLPREERLSVIALDVDPQGSLSNFFSERQGRGFDDYGIASKTLTEAATKEDLTVLADSCDVLIVDMPGTYSANLLSLALSGDVIVVPTNLRLIEVQETAKVINQITDLADRYNFPARPCILFTRVAAQWSFTPKFGKAMLEYMCNCGYPILDARLSEQSATGNIVDLCRYLFEQSAESAQSASAIRASHEARALLEAVRTFRLMPPAKDTADTTRHSEEASTHG